MPGEIISLVLWVNLHLARDPAGTKISLPACHRRRVLGRETLLKQKIFTARRSYGAIYSSSHRDVWLVEKKDQTKAFRRNAW